MIVHYDDFLLEQILNESSLNENIDFEKINDFIKNFGNKEELKSQLLTKINNTKNLITRKNLVTILIVLFSLNMISRNSIWSQQINPKYVEKMATEIAKQPTISEDKIKNIINEKTKKSDFNIDNAKTSQDAKNFIKDHEKLNLEAYAIGDDMITIGYGHASPERKSKWNVGDKITKEKAERLFEDDIIEAEDGVKRIIKSWEKSTIENSLNQGMFDALVSMAYNLGISGLKHTTFMQLVKAGKFGKAAEALKTTKIKSVIRRGNKKYHVEMPGLIDRRETEYNFFIKDLV